MNKVKEEMNPVMVRRCTANSNYNYKIFFHPDQKLQAKLKSRENPVWFGVIRTPRNIS